MIKNIIKPLTALTSSPRKRQRKSPMGWTIDIYKNPNKCRFSENAYPNQTYLDFLKMPTPWGLSLSLAET